MVNRNPGSGTRILTDRLLAGAAVAVAQSRADWGIAIETMARQYRLGFIPAEDEHYDFIVPKTRLVRPAVRRFFAVLEDPATRQALTELGFGI
jgi:putative molybdopterin biosynthesis protein